MLCLIVIFLWITSKVLSSAASKVLLSADSKGLLSTVLSVGSSQTFQPCTQSVQAAESA
jgi:hypothetical protein